MTSVVVLMTVGEDKASNSRFSIYTLVDTCPELFEDCVFLWLAQQWKCKTASVLELVIIVRHSDLSESSEAGRRRAVPYGSVGSSTLRDHHLCTHVSIYVCMPVCKYY